MTPMDFSSPAGFNEAAMVDPGPGLLFDET
jgi:hypothetical protein